MDWPDGNKGVEKRPNLFGAENVTMPERTNALQYFIYGGAFLKMANAILLTLFYLRDFKLLEYFLC